MKDIKVNISINNGDFMHLINTGHCKFDLCSKKNLSICDKVLVTSHIIYRKHLQSCIVVIDKLSYRYSNHHLLTKVYTVECSLVAVVTTKL